MPSADRALPLRHAVALGLLQGPAELLPVSSSGHTTLIPWLARWPYTELDPESRKSFEVALHAGAGVALAIHMRRELLADAARLDRGRALMIALSLAPPALAGYMLGGPIERGLGGPRSIALGLVGGAVTMAVADGRAARAADAGRAREDAGALDGLALGLAQACALIPGVSRNGATLTAARARGFSRRAAQTLSWHAGLPVILGASLHRGARMLADDGGHEPRSALAAGAGSAFVATLASATVVRRWRLNERSLLPYSLYRFALAALVTAQAREREAQVGRARARARDA